MNIGSQKKTEEKYLNYLRDFFSLRGEIHLHNVNLRDSKLLDEYFKNSNTGYSSLIKYYKKCGIIVGQDDYYIPKVKAYLYTLSLEKLKKYKIINNNIINNKYNNNKTPIKATKVELAPDFQVYKKAFYNISDDEIISALLLRYPQVLDYQAIIEELNTSIYTYGNSIHMWPKITRGSRGYVSKIGIRASQVMCSYQTLENHPNTKSYTREEELTALFGEWEKYDVKGSIPRLSRALWTDEVIDMHVDPYYEIFKSVDFSKIFDNGSDI